MKRIILDTTYVLPLFGFEVNGDHLTKDMILQLWNEGIIDYEIYLPSICLLEVVYRINAELRKEFSDEIADRYKMVIPTILNSSKITIFASLNDFKVAEFVFKLRKLGHPDLSDCLIASTAYSLNGILISEDQTLKKIIEKEMNPKLTILSLNQFINSINYK